MPSFNDLWASIGQARQQRGVQTEQVFDAIGGSAKIPGMMARSIPQITDLLMNQYTSPILQLIQRSSEAGTASLVSGMQRRGLTGSSIEQQALRGRESDILANKTNFIAESANKLTNYIQQAVGSDVTAERSALMSLAQATGQEVQNQREMKMFYDLLRRNELQAAANRQSAMTGSLISAGAGIIGTAMGGPMGGMAASKLGGMLAGGGGGGGGGGMMGGGGGGMMGGGGLNLGSAWPSPSYGGLQRFSAPSTASWASQPAGYSGLGARPMWESVGRLSVPQAGLPSFSGYAGGIP